MRNETLDHQSEKHGSYDDSPIYDDNQPSWRNKTGDNLEDNWNANNSDYNPDNPTSKAGKSAGLDGEGIEQAEANAGDTGPQAMGAALAGENAAEGGSSPVRAARRRTAQHPHESI